MVSTSRSWARHTAGSIETSRRWRVTTIATAKPAIMTSEATSPVRSLPPGDPIMTPTPASAPAIAIQPRGATRSPSAIQASSAAATGDTACTKRTRATDVWFRAMMKPPEATAMQTATTMPSRPIATNACRTRPRSANAA